MITIQDLFERDIHRPINGVVKADQLDASAVWQELDEFVVTSELGRHIHDLVEVLLSTIGTPNADKNGVWVSGFFGCGKSHFIKVLSYLLENNEHVFGDQRRRAVDFFDEKLGDALLYADLKKVVAARTDTILFNVDSKADHRAGRDALLGVFLKVLNEKQGYSGDHPHIAHMERHLDEKGKLATFHAAFEGAAGSPWLHERDAWEFHRDEVVAALTTALGQSPASVEKWVDGAADNFSLTVEGFAGWVKRYLDGRGPAHRIMFLVDEVGQFIGNDTHLMLNLQTITEQLGTVCAGRAWVVVTSQEDLEAALGDLQSTKQHDFSKIQGRFETRLSLSSRNVDEVIKKRLLDKRAEAHAALTKAYDGKHDILRNQLSFMQTGKTFKTYADVADFAACYPFAAYQFTLVQNVFESIRKAGATGLHLSQGERSTLDAFQSAARQLGDCEIGALVPFYRFYPAVEGFLDTAVRRTIDRAAETHTLEPFDPIVLKVLFLIRYIDELPGSVANLVTLCVDEIDADRLALRTRIEASLGRLEAETLIARNGDLYFFLTNEERDIGREIKSTNVPSGDEERELGRLIFEDILGGDSKHTFSATKRDFTYTRFCDGKVVGRQLDGSLEVVVVSPLSERYAEFVDDEASKLHTIAEQGRVLVRLPDKSSLGRELRTYVQTELYVKAKRTGTLPDTTKRILRDRTEDNRARRRRIVLGLKALLADASWFACGTQLKIGANDAKAALGEALEYLIKNAYSKMSYVQHLHAHPKQEIQITLRANDLDQVSLGLKTPEANLQALDDLREYVRLCALTSKQIVLHDLIHKRYGRRPYGWVDLEVVLLVARLAVLKEITLIVNQAPLPLDRAYEHLTSVHKQRKVVIIRREVADSDLLKKAQALGKDLFAQGGPSAEDGLFAFLKAHLTHWHSDLGGFKPLAQTGDYPGLGDITDALATLRKFVEETDSLRFLRRFVANRSALLDLADDYREIEGFYTNQKHSWELLRRTVAAVAQNGMQLEQYPEAGPALARMEAILAMPRPYAVLHEAADLMHTATTANDALVTAARSSTVAEIKGLIDGVIAELDTVSASPALRTRATTQLKTLIDRAAKATSIAHIAQARAAAEKAFDQALTAIEDVQVPPESPVPPQPEVTDGDDPPPPKPPKPPTFKKRRVVTPKQLWTGGFITTQADIEAFLTTLRATLEAAVEANERVQLK